MKKVFKVKGYDLTRKSENKVFTHAVIYVNTVNPKWANLEGASFHVSLKLAQDEANRMTTKCSTWIKVIDIVEVEELAKVAA